MASANDSGQDSPYSWSLYEKELRPALDGKICKRTRRPLKSVRRLCGPQPHLCLVPLCPPCPARIANLEDTLHFLEKGALGLPEQELLSHYFQRLTESVVGDHHGGRQHGPAGPSAQRSKLSKALEKS